MKFNFYISADGPFEVQSVIDFIDWMNDKQRGDVTLGEVLKRASGREIGAKDSGKKVDNDSETSGLDSHPTTRSNVNPGFVACQKIGTETKDTLLAALPSGDVEHIAKKIKRTPDQTKSFLQLMWDRDLIKYDGSDFYV